PRGRQREEIASDYYYGGMVVERSASLHPALYYKGLLDACRRRDVTICAEAAVEKIAANGAGWWIETSRGTLTAGDVVIATNGYTGTVTPALRRRIVPIASHIIATEQLAPELALSLIPRGRSISDTKRVLCYYRLSPDGTRMVFGGRARFTPADPELCARVLHGYMTERFPQLKGARVTHSWTGNTAFTLDALPHMGEEGGLHYCLGCNGSGVAMMTYLGTQTARKIGGHANGDWHQGHRCAQDQADEKGAWAHAYLHRVEGDEMNAGGWYKRAGKTVPTTPLDQEWEEIARALLTS